jgi:hypothetical protein
MIPLAWQKYWSTFGVGMKGCSWVLRRLVMLETVESAFTAYVPWIHLLLVDAGTVAIDGCGVMLNIAGYNVT